MTKRDYNKLAKLTSDIADLTIAKESRIVDGTSIVPDTKYNADLDERIGILREQCLVIRGAAGSMAHLQYLKYEGRK